MNTQSENIGDLAATTSLEEAREIALRESKNLNKEIPIIEDAEKSFKMDGPETRNIWIEKFPHVSCESTNANAELIEINSKLVATMIERDEALKALKKCREDSLCYSEHMRKCGYSEACKESQDNADRAMRIIKKTE